MTTPPAPPGASGASGTDPVSGLPSSGMPHSAGPASAVPYAGPSSAPPAYSGATALPAATAFPGTTTAEPLPGPPPGPGVAPPFASPPTDRDNKRVWIGLGVGGLVLLLCCVAGVVGIGVLASGGTGIVESEARSTVSQFLSAVVAEDYSAAYEVVCDTYTDRNSLQVFQRRVATPKIEDYTINGVRILSESIMVDANVEFTGAAASRTYTLVQQMDGLRVCAGF